MKKISAIVFLALTFTINVIAQSELNFEFDYARFKYDSLSVFMEFYYDLNTKNMQLTPSQNGSLVEAIVHIEMKKTDSDTFFINKNWKIQNIISDPSPGSAPKSLTGVFGFNVSEGSYSLLVKVYDAKNPQLKKIINERVEIIPHKNDKFSISDIQLATNITKEGADPNSIFYKNTLEIIPNPSMVYTVQSPAAFYYAELYNLILNDPMTDFSLQKLLYNSAGNAVYKQTKTIKQAKNSAVEMGVINLSKYPTDSYNLVLSLIDNKTNEAFISSKRFYLYNPNVVDSSATKVINIGVLGSEFALLNAQECDKMFLQSKYIASQKEIDMYKKIDSLSAKCEFLYYFWKNRDTDPTTPQNEFKQDYMRRVEYANRNFRFINKEGYLTDRGRVYLVYGEPDQRDFYPSEPNLKPYELWFYNSIEGGVSFIFGDVTGFGNYELLHSTKRGEVKDDNWIRRISTE